MVGDERRKTVRELHRKTMREDGKKERKRKKERRRGLRSKGAHERAKKGGMRWEGEGEGVGSKTDLGSISASTLVGITTIVSISVSISVSVATMISIPIPIPIPISIVISITTRTIVIAVTIRTMRAIRVPAIITITISISVTISSTIPVTISAVTMIERITTTAIQILFIEKGLISFPVPDAIGLALDVDRRRIIVVLVMELIETIANHLVADVNFSSKVISETFVAIGDAEEETTNIASDEFLLLVVTRLTSQLTDQSQRIVRLEKGNI